MNAEGFGGGERDTSRDSTRGVSSVKGSTCSARQADADTGQLYIHPNMRAAAIENEALQKLTSGSTSSACRMKNSSQRDANCCSPSADTGQAAATLGFRVQGVLGSWNDAVRDRPSCASPGKKRDNNAIGTIVRSSPSKSPSHSRASTGFTAGHRGWGWLGCLGSCQPQRRSDTSCFQCTQDAGDEKTN